MSASRRSQIFVGVDTGGTFTDVVYRDGAASGRMKLLSTPDDPARAVLEALSALFGHRPPELLTYGTTIATNAMIERRGARTVLLTTAGFEDVLEIGRQARPDLYDLEPVRPDPLVPASRRIGALERTLFDGSVLTALSDKECRRIRRLVADAGAEAIAICLLHSTVRADHELRLGRALQDLDVPITLSHTLSPMPGEYERCSTTVANAFVQPKVSRHIRRLAEHSGAARLRVMQSNGGAIGAESAGREPVRTMLSGPAGGVAGAMTVVAHAGARRVVTLDMGGTSTDVAFIDGEAPRRSVTHIAGLPIAVPCIDIHTVGAGGGSIASIDAGGALQVGPQSAGADPGPACYGRGDAPTVTDANAVLGRLPPRHFLGGSLVLDVARARKALAPLARTIGATLEQTAEGIVRVVEGNMERAIRTITVQRGEDPRSCALVAFGGAAGLHACGLAQQLGFEEVLIPRDPGLLSAQGVLDSRVTIDRMQPLRAIDPGYDLLVRHARSPMRLLRGDIAREGIAAGRIRVAVMVRARYLGQSLEVEVPLVRGWRRRFDDAHHRLYHSRASGRPVEVVGLRLTGIGEEAAARSARQQQPRRRAAVTVEEHAEAFAHHRKARVPLVRRESLGAGAHLAGPAIIVEYSSTTWVETGFGATVDEHGNLRLRRKVAKADRR